MPPLCKTSVRSLSSWYTLSQISAEQKVTSISAGRSGAAFHSHPPKGAALAASAFAQCPCCASRPDHSWPGEEHQKTLFSCSSGFAAPLNGNLDHMAMQGFQLLPCVLVNIEVVRHLHHAIIWVTVSIQTTSYQILESLSTLTARGARDGGETVAFLWLKPRHCINRTFGLVSENSARD